MLKTTITAFAAAALLAGAAAAAEPVRVDLAKQLAGLQCQSNAGGVQICLGGDATIGQVTSFCWSTGVSSGCTFGPALRLSATPTK